MAAFSVVESKPLQQIEEGRLPAKIRQDVAELDQPVSQRGRMIALHGRSLHPSPAAAHEEQR
jgi:hypothetical protein